MISNEKGSHRIAADGSSWFTGGHVGERPEGIGCAFAYTGSWGYWSHRQAAYWDYLGRSKAYNFRRRYLPAELPDGPPLSDKNDLKRDECTSYIMFVAINHCNRGCIRCVDRLLAFIKIASRNSRKLL